MNLNRTVAVSAIAALLGTGVPAWSDASEDSIGFASDANGAIVVPVTLDGTGPFPFLLDTGSNGSTVSESVARVLGARPVAKTSVTTSTGSDVVTVIRVGTMTVGSTTVMNILPVVVPDPALRAVRVSGVIGQDFLGSLNYTINYRGRRLEFGDSYVAAAGERLKLERADDRFLVDLPQPNGRGGVLRMVPDSGSASVVVFTDGGRPRVAVQRFPVPESVRLTSVTGAQQVERGVLDRLRIGPVVWRDETCVLVNRAGGNQPAGDGLLPLHRFARVSFNTTEGYMTVE